MLGIVGWIVFGLIVGALAKLLMPGRDPGGIWVTIASPPVGFNLFVLQNMTGRDVFTIGWMSLPFFLMMVITIVLLTTWPQIVTVLPSLYS